MTAPQVPDEQHERHEPQVPDEPHEQHEPQVPDEPRHRYDAVVLAGGAARRLGGVDKPAVEVGGRSLLDAVLAAVADARARVVVGPPRSLPPEVVQVREEPPGGGPVPALTAGLARVASPWVAVLAADLPFLTGDTVTRLRAAAADADVALLVDDEGRDQYLCGVWRTAALREALPAAGTRLRALLPQLRVVRVPVVSWPAPWFDCDTEADLARARAERSPTSPPTSPQT